MATRTLCVICSGNICRSPYGEGILRKLIGEAGLDVTVISAGTLMIEDRPAHEHTLTVGLERGVDLDTHRSQGVSKALVEKSTALLCMSPGHVEEIREWFPDATPKTFLFAAYPEFGSDEHDIPDPIGTPVENFRECFDAIDEAASRIVSILQGFTP